MNGRARVTGPVGLAMWMFVPALERNHLEYVGGVMDALDGSHGPEFTYLPIVYQDDCQVALGDFHHVRSDEMRHEINLSFLGAAGDGRESELPNNRFSGPAPPTAERHVGRQIK